jgi:hypothetical protein
MHRPSRGAPWRPSVFLDWGLLASGRKLEAEIMARTAASLLLLIVLSAGVTACDSRTPSPGGPPPSAPEPIGPRGPVALPATFTWKPVPGPSSPVYRVRVTDAAERVLFEQDVRKTECEPSAELAAMMGDHGAFTWTVGVLSPDGAEVVARSAPIVFSLK